MGKAARWVAEKWKQFFFEPTSPATLGLFRICFGVVVFLSLLGRFPYRELFYGQMGLVTYQTMDKYFPGNPILYFRWLPWSDPGLEYYFLVFMLAAVFLTFGFMTRISGVLVFCGLMSLSNRNLFVDNAGDDLLRINSFWLMFAQAGAAYSVDRWLKVKRGKESSQLPQISPWPQRLLQLQLAYVYLQTAYLKLPGESWRDGTAIYYALNYIELRRFRPKYLFYYLWQVKIATWGTLVAEFSAATLVWFRKLRYWILSAAFLLHFGINLTLQFPIFQYVMMASLVNFFYPEDVEKAFAWVKKKMRLYAKRL